MALRARPSGLTALSATVDTIGIVNQVADCLPIVTDVLRIVWRIAALAEKIERQRQALRDLVVKSQSLGRSIRAVVADSVPSVLLAESLNGIYRVLDEVEQFMAKHLAKSRFMRFLAYVLTMAGHIEQLKEDLANASMEFLLVACLDTNARVAAMRAPVIERIIYADLPSARCIVKHHAVLSSPTYSVPSSLGVQSFTIAIIRRTMASVPIIGAAAIAVANHMKQILRAMRTPVLRKQYFTVILSGRDDKPLKRLTVLKLDPVLTSAKAFIRARNEINASSRIALKAMDAASHLSRHGIDWVPPTSDVHVDPRGEPLLGRDMDLYKKAPEKAASVYQTQMGAVFVLYEELPIWHFGEQIKEVRYRLAMGLPTMSRYNPAIAPAARTLSQMLATLTQARKASMVLPMSDFVAHPNVPNLRLHGSDDYLSTVNAVLGTPAPLQPCILARIMTLLVKGTNSSELRADYCPADTGDKVVVIWLDAFRIASVRLNMCHVNIPDSRRDETRKAFGIASRLVNLNLPSFRLF